MTLKNIVMAVLLLTSMAACEDMNYLHKDIIDRGETIYAARVDSVFTGSGHNKVAFKIVINTQKIETLRFLWNNKLDSIEMEVGNRTGVFNFVIDKLDEKEYVFDLVSLDMYGNKSLPVEAIGQSLGNLYIEALMERKIPNITVDENEVLHIEWGIADNNVIKSVITYPKKDGTMVSKEIEPSVSSLEITDFMYGGKYTQQTYYRPNELSPDLFTTKDGLTGNFPNEKTKNK